jgi:hypothetical protein
MGEVMQITRKKNKAVLKDIINHNFNLAVSFIRI